jgi:hypothetical protein
VITPESAIKASLERRLHEIAALKAADASFEDRTSLQDLLIDARTTRLSPLDRFEIVANVELIYARRNLDSGHVAAALSISATTRSHLERILENSERIGCAEFRMIALVMRFRLENLERAGDHITMVSEMGMTIDWIERAAETDDSRLRLETLALLAEILDLLGRARHEALLLPQTEGLVKRIRSGYVRKAPRADGVIRVIELARSLDRRLSSLRISAARPGGEEVCNSCGLKVDLFSARCGCS